MANAAVKGYRIILTMPETMSIERRNILKAYGAEIVLTEGFKGMKGAIERAEQLQKEIKGSYIPGQFVNPANPDTHKRTTGPEIWEDTDGKIDFFVAGVGTGGTITGTGSFLKSKNPDVKVIAVEPERSPVLSGGTASGHKIQGIGAGFIPETLDTKVYDEVVKVPDEAAFDTAKLLAKTDGILTEISSGAAMWAGLELAKKTENEGKNHSGDSSRQRRQILFHKIILGMICVIYSEIPHSILNGDREKGLPGNVNFCFEGIEGESLLLLLDDKGISASSGSACTSGALDPSHVLLALGRPYEIAHGSLRLSLSEENTDEEIEYIINAVKEVVKYLREMSPVWRDLISGKK